MLHTEFDKVFVCGDSEFARDASSEQMANH